MSWLTPKPRKKSIQSILKEARESTQNHQEILARERFFEDFKNRQREKVRDFTSDQESPSRLNKSNYNEQLCFPWLLQEEKN